MFQNKEVHVVIDRCGRPTIRTEGFTGEACLKATANLEKVLTAGKGEVNREFGPEFYQVNTESENTERLEW